ncbi:MAG: LuxR family transcriptional regulator [Xanthobacteraceae bacterium]|nr:LuxR family transcriptional regulator [Xanthobacteraceae bacterium]
MARQLKLSNLIEEVYDAALEPALWNDVVSRISDFVDAQACGLISKDSASKSGATHYYCGVDPHYIQLYSDTYSRFDPLKTLPPLGQVVGIPDLVAYDEYRRGPFYQEWLRPQGCVDVANALLEKSGSSAVLLTFLPGKDRMLDSKMRRRIALVAPHAHRALLINKAIDFKETAAATFADVLNTLSAGIFLIDAHCQIVHTNAAGQDMLCADDVLRSVGGRLVVRDVQISQALKQVCVFIDVTKCPRSAAFPLIALDGERYIAHLLPLASATRGTTGTAYKAVAALFVRKAALDSQSCGDLIARTFELTPAETRVLLSIVEVGGVPGTAEALGIAETTVKTHLHRVFAKTGASRQADLVKLTAGFSNPLAG